MCLKYALRDDFLTFDIVSAEVTYVCRALVELGVTSTRRPTSMAHEHVQSQALL